MFELETLQINLAEAQELRDRLQKTQLTLKKIASDPAKRAECDALLKMKKSNAWSQLKYFNWIFQDANAFIDVLSFKPTLLNSVLAKLDSGIKNSQWEVFNESDQSLYVLFQKLTEFFISRKQSEPEAESFIDSKIKENLEEWSQTIPCTFRFTREEADLLYKTTHLAVVELRQEALLDENKKPELIKFQELNRNFNGMIKRLDKRKEAEAAKAIEEPTSPSEQHTTQNNLKAGYTGGRIRIAPPVNLED